jgi:pantothenate kinase
VSAPRTATDREVAAWVRSHPGIRLVGIAGIPGAGKSTLAAKLSGIFPGSAVIPMDGYHFPLAQLDVEGKRRRGSAPTFDAAAFRRDLERLKRTGGGVFPGWSHARHDPEPGAIAIGPQTRPIFVEGLYVLMDAWGTGPLFDLRIFVDCEVATALRRVEDRLVANGHVPGGRAAARHRVETNDRLNAEAILADGGRERADFVVRT